MVYMPIAFAFNKTEKLEKCMGIFQYYKLKLIKRDWQTKCFANCYFKVVYWGEGYYDAFRVFGISKCHSICALQEIIVVYPL